MHGRARSGSHLQNNATVKPDYVPNDSDAPRSSLRCCAGERAADGHITFFCLSVHLPVHSYACTQHICFRTRVSRAEKKFAFVAAPWPGPEEPEEPWPQLCSPSEQMNGGRPRRHLSVGGDLRLSGGHLIALSRWPEIKNVLLCLWFCRDLKPRPGGEQFTAARL